jgi:hypothetical protein
MFKRNTNEIGYVVNRIEGATFGEHRKYLRTRIGQ